MPRNNIKAKQLPDVLSLPAQTVPPPPPSAGDVSLYTRRRAGYDFLEIMRESGRDIAMQPHFGINRIALWTPSGTSAINTLALLNAITGTRTHATPGAGNLAVSCRRWTLTSAATVGAAADERGSTLFMWRGNGPGLGGFVSILRFRTTSRPAGCNAFFGLANSTSAIAVMDLEAATHTAQYLGIGFKAGVHTTYQLIYKGAGTGALNFVDLGPDFPVNDSNAVFTLYLFSPQNGSFVGARVVREDDGKIAEIELADQLPIPQNNILLTPRLHMDNGTGSTAVVFECYGVYCETDY